MRGFADDVAWLCGELSFSKCAVIGHSMGGIIAFDLAVRHPELVAAVVMIDAAVVAKERHDNRVHLIAPLPSLIHCSPQK